MQKGTSTGGEDPAVSAVLIIFGLIVAIGALRYGWGSFDSPGAGFLPFFAGVAIAGFAAIPFLQSWRRGWRPLRDLWQGVRWQRAAVATVSLLLYSAFLQTLGFLISTLILTTYLYRLLEPTSWKESLLAALATTLGFYLVFQTWLEAQLPRGLLGF